MQSVIIIIFTCCCHCCLALNQPDVNQLVIQEDIAKGHRVKRFHIQALINNKWKTMAEGSAIGHKYIQLLDKPVVAKKIRLMIDDAFAEPDIINFAVYQVTKQ